MRAKPSRFFTLVHDPGLRQIAALSLPVMVASWVGPVNLMINGKAVIMLGGPFDYVSVNFAYSLFSVISGVFVLSVANVIFPQLSKQQATGDDSGFGDTLTKTLRSLVFFLLPMTFGMIALNKPLVRLIFESGLFAERAVEATAGALLCFSLGMLGFGLQTVLCRACYALRDGRTPLVAAIAAIALNATLSFVLVPRMGANGAALASSVAISVNAVMMWAVLARKGKVKLSSDKMDLTKMLALALLMYAAVRGCGKVFDGLILSVAAPVAAGVIVYLGGGWLLKLDEMRNLTWRLTTKS